MSTATVNISGIVSYEDADTVTNLTDDLSALDSCYASADPTNCITNSNFNFVDTDPTSATFGEVIFTAQSDTGAESDIKSKARAVGIALGEVGLSFSREWEMFGTEVAVGLTPKIVSITVFDYEAGADSADSDSIEADDYSVDYTDYNLDAGIAMDHKNGWRSGLVIKNILSKDYKAKRTDPDTGIQTETGLTGFS